MSKSRGAKISSFAGIESSRNPAFSAEDRGNLLPVNLVKGHLAKQTETRLRTFQDLCVQFLQSTFGRDQSKLLTWKKVAFAAIPCPGMSSSNRRKQNGRDVKFTGGNVCPFLSNSKSPRFW